MEQEQQTGVQFQEEDEYQSSQSFYPKTPKLVSWIMKYSGGIIKNERQANYVLIGIAVIAFAISFYLFFGGKNVTYRRNSAPHGYPTGYPVPTQAQ